jgi:uncharacterized protein YyaL (SSP411 family)
MDNATPSANGLAATALVRLYALTGDDSYRERSAEVLRLLGPLVARHPMGFAQALAAVRLHHEGPTEVAVAGDGPELVAVVTARFRPTTVLAWGEPYDSPLGAGRGPAVAGTPRAFVCRDHACQAPVTTPEALAAQLGDP